MKLRVPRLSRIGLTLLSALLLSGKVFTPDGVKYNTSGQIYFADAIERRMFVEDHNPETPPDFYFSFVSVYRVNGVEVRPDVFWANKLIDRHVDIKALRRVGFWFVTAINVTVPK